MIKTKLRNAELSNLSEDAFSHNSEVFLRHFPRVCEIIATILVCDD